MPAPVSGPHAHAGNSVRRHTGGTKKPISYEKFARGVTAQTNNLREQAGCGQIELRLVVGVPTGQRWSILNQVAHCPAHALVVCLPGCIVVGAQNIEIIVGQ